MGEFPLSLFSFHLDDDKMTRINQGVLEHMDKCHIGIIGAGRIGKLHAQHLKYHMPQFILAAIADPEIDREWAQQLSINKICKQAEEVLLDPHLDAVLIASPSTLHIEQIKMASQAGKAIFCEKPIGLNEDEIISVLELLNSNHTLLQLGFNRRFDPSFSNVHKRLLSGEIGAPQIVKITSRDPVCPPKNYIASSGGMFMDMSIHDFDMARFLMQSEVVELYTSGSVLINADFEAFNDVDTAITQLRFANNALAVIDNSRQAVYGYDQRIEVLGETGMLLAANQLEHSVSHYTKASTTQANPQYFFLERYHQAFIAELHAFYDAWANNQHSPVSAWDGLQAHRIAKAAQQSLKTRLPVILD